MTKVTLALIDHEILSTPIYTVPLLWHVQKFQAALQESEGMVQWLNCALVNSMWLAPVTRRVNYKAASHSQVFLERHI
jgi:hypothetical protein